jgi:hypothetical protein
VTLLDRGSIHAINDEIDQPIALAQARQASRRVGFIVSDRTRARSLRS